MTTTKNRPADTIQLGVVKAVIWGNSRDDGTPPRFSVQYFKAYRTQEGQWKETTSFNEIDNLKLGVLIPEVAKRIAELRKEAQSMNAEGAE